MSGNPGANNSKAQAQAPASAFGQEGAAPPNPFSFGNPKPVFGFGASASGGTSAAGTSGASPLGTTPQDMERFLARVRTTTSASAGANAPAFGFVEFGNGSGPRGTNTATAVPPPKEPSVEGARVPDQQTNGVAGARNRTSAEGPAGGSSGGGASASVQASAAQPSTASARVNLPATKDTSAPASSKSGNKNDPSGPNTATVVPSQKEPSAEAPRAPDQQTNGAAAARNQTSAEGPTARVPSSGTQGTTQQPTTGSIFGGGGTGSLDFDSNQFAARFMEALRQPATSTGTGSGLFTKGFSFDRPQQQQSAAGVALSPEKLKNIEELLRQSLLGEELVNTQFHLFFAKSSSSRRVMKPRVLCINNALLARSSKYFLDLLSSDANPSDASMVDLTGDNDIPSDAQIDEYGYESDSDLDECDFAETIASDAKVDAKAQLKDDKGKSVASDTVVANPEQFHKDGAGSTASNEKRTVIRLRSLESRHVLVRDAAFQTWYTLLNYLYTGKFSFLPLSSTTPGRRRTSSTSSIDVPRCSAKSMYRLASKVGLDRIRNEAFSYIRSNLTEHNILKELSCSMVAKHPELCEMELDVLYSHIASPPIVANFAVLAQRISHNELAHGADIVMGIYTRLLKRHFPFPLGSTAGLSSFAKPGVGADASGASSQREGGNSGSVPSVPPDCNVN